MPNTAKGYRLVEISETEYLDRSKEQLMQVLMFNNKLAINVEEFAELMGIGRENAMRLIEMKEDPVPHKRAGNRIIISFPALIKWLENWNGDSN